MRQPEHNKPVSCSNDNLEILFEKLGDGGVAGDAVGVLEHIMALILKDQIVGPLSDCLKLLNHIPRLALNDAGIVLALNHQQRASDLLHVGARRADRKSTRLNSSHS